MSERVCWRALSRESCSLKITLQCVVRYLQLLVTAIHKVENDVSKSLQTKQNKTKPIDDIEEQSNTMTKTRNVRAYSQEIVHAAPEMQQILSARIWRLV